MTNVRVFACVVLSYVVVWVGEGVSIPMMVVMVMVMVTLMTMMMVRCAFLDLVKMTWDRRCESTCGSEDDNNGGGGRCETHIDIQPVNEVKKKVLKRWVKRTWFRLG